jgi:hypothetical protein
MDNLNHLSTSIMCDDPLLRVRLDGVSEAQKRTRTAFLASIIVSLAIIITAWKAYFSWYRVFPQQAKRADNEVTKDAQQKLTEEWVRSLKVSIPILGIYVGISDGSVLGALSLYIISTWLFFSVRRENHIIGELLQDTQGCSWEVQNMVFHGVVVYSVFTTATKIDEPIRKLNDVPGKERSELARGTFILLIYMPVIAIGLLIILDVLSVLYFESPFRFPNTSLIKANLTGIEWGKIIVFDLIAFFLCIINYFSCHEIHRYNSYTGDLLKEYQKLRDEKRRVVKQIT